MNTNFKVCGSTGLGIKAKSTAPEADALTTGLSELFVTCNSNRLIHFDRFLFNRNFDSEKCNLANVRMNEASVSGAVDLGWVPSRVKPITLKLAFTGTLPDAQHYRDSVGNKPSQE